MAARDFWSAAICRSPGSLSDLSGTGKVSCHVSNGSITRGTTFLGKGLADESASLSLRAASQQLRDQHLRTTGSAVAGAEPVTSSPTMGIQNREAIRLALPSKGRMAEDTLDLLKSCQLTLRKPNPRQYIADIVEIGTLEVWFQRASDVVRKLRSGDIDLGIVGYDMVREYGQDDDELVVVHDALSFGKCHLAVAIPQYGIFRNVNTLDELLSMPQWTERNPLRVVTGYTFLGAEFFRNRGFHHVHLSTADGALEAAPAMGTADAILDLVESGTTLRENNLKEIEGGRVMDSQGVLVANRRSLLHRPGVLTATREMLERLEAHLRAKNQFMVTANMRGETEEEVADRIFRETEFPGLQGPTISKVYTRSNGSSSPQVHYFSVTVCVPKGKIYDSIQELRKAGGSGVLVTPVTYIFDEEPLRWNQLLGNLGLGSDNNSVTNSSTS